MRTIDWYFDFISPFSYLQAEILHTLPPDVEVRFRPVLFAGLLKHWDNKGPAEIAPKRDWTFAHVLWIARKLGVPIRFPAHHPYNPLPLLRLCIALDCTPEVVRHLFRYVWRDGHLPTDERPWQALLAELDVTPAMLDAPGVKDALRRNGEDAIAAGVFGVPTAVVDGRAFWGVDATDMLIAFLRNDPFFSDGTLDAVANLAPGLQRPQPGKGPA